MSTVLERTIANVSAMRADAAERYAKLVKDLARDQDIDAEETMQILADADRSLGELEADVHRLVQRIKAAADLAGLVAAQDALASAQGEQYSAELARDIALQKFEADVLRKREALLAEHAAKIEALSRPVSEAGDRVAAAHAGRSLLLDSASPEIKDRIADLRKQRAAELAEHQRFATRAAEQRRIIDCTTVPPARDEVRNPYRGTPLDIKRARGEERRAIELATGIVSTATARLREYQAWADGRASTIAAIDREVRDLESQMLIP